MTLYAAMMVGEDNTIKRERAVSAAKVQIGRSSKAIGHQSIQLHGGIGMTMEYSIGHYFKHVVMIDTLFGDADHHLRRLAALGGLRSVPSTEPKRHGASEAVKSKRKHGNVGGKLRRDDVVLPAVKAAGIAVVGSTCVDPVTRKACTKTSLYMNFRRRGNHR